MRPMRSPPSATLEQLVWSDAAATPAQQAIVTLTVRNIGCEACAARVKTGLSSKFGTHIASVCHLIVPVSTPIHLSCCRELMDAACKLFKRLQII